MHGGKRYHLQAKSHQHSPNHLAKHCASDLRCGVFVTSNVPRSTTITGSSTTNHTFRFPNPSIYKTQSHAITPFDRRNDKLGCNLHLISTENRPGAGRRSRFRWTFCALQCTPRRSLRTVRCGRQQQQPHVDGFQPKHSPHQSHFN